MFWKSAQTGTILNFAEEHEPVVYFARTGTVTEILDLVFSALKNDILTNDTPRHISTINLKLSKQSKTIFKI